MAVINEQKTTKERAEQAAAMVKDTAASKASKAQETIGTVDSVQAQASTMVDKTKETATEKANEVVSRIGVVTDTANDKFHALQEKAEEAMDTVLEGFDVGRKAATEEWKATAIEAKEFANAKVAAREAQVDHAKESINGKFAELDEKSQRRLNW